MKYIVDRLPKTKKDCDNSEKNDMDLITFVEEYLGIELLPYQKEYLKWLSNQDTKHTYWITCPPKTGYSLIREIMKRCLQRN